MKLIVALRSDSKSTHGKFWQAYDDGDKLVILFGAVGSKPNRRDVPRNACSGGVIEREAWARANKKMREGYEKDTSPPPPAVKKANRASTDNRIYLSGTVKRVRLEPFWRTLAILEDEGLFSTPIELVDGKGRAVSAAGALTALETAAAVVANGQEVSANASITGGGAFSLSGATLSVNIEAGKPDGLASRVVMELWARCLEDDVAVVFQGQAVDIAELQDRGLPSEPRLSEVAVALGLKAAPINTTVLAKAGVRQALVF